MTAPTPTPEQAAPVDPSSIAYRVHAHAFNTLTEWLATDERFVPLSVRDNIATAIVGAVEPLIRADERAIAAQEPAAAVASGAQTFTWDYRQPAPMDEIAAAVRELSGGAVRMSMPETGSGEYELVISRIGETGDGTLRTRVTRLAETWEASPKLTEEGQLLRDLGQVLRDELGHASDREPEPAPELPGARYALVEQMGHRATTGTVREVTFCGAPMLEVTDLKTGSVHLASPQSLYEVTWLTEAEARQRAKPWTAVAIPAADPWGTAESDLDDDADEDDEDDGVTASEPHAADEPRDLAREAEPDPWFGPAGATAAAPVNPIEAAAKRAVGWREDQPQQQAPANGTGPQAAQRMML